MNRSRRLLCILILLLIHPVAPARAVDKVEVSVTGVSGELLHNVQVTLAVPSGLVREGQVDSHWLERYRQQIPAKVKKALEPFGYFRAQAEVELDRSDAHSYRLVVEVRPGAPTKLDEVEVAVEGAGAESPALQLLVRQFPLQRGSVLRQDRYDEAKGKFRARALDLGYLDAEFSSHKVLVKRGAGTALIELVLQTGPRYHFGPIRFSGADAYPERFLRRYLAFAPGAVFSFPKLGATQRNLLDTDRFKEVNVVPRHEQSEAERVPVDVQLLTSPSQRLRPGIGYGTDTGARFSLRFLDLNVLRRGHEMHSDLYVGEFRQSLGASYLIPSVKNIDSQTKLQLGLERENTTAYETRSVSSELERLRGFGRGKLGSTYVRLLYEEYRIGRQDSSSSMIIPGLRYSARHYPDPVRPRRGYQYRLEVRGTHQGLGSELGLLQLLGRGNRLFPLPGRMTLFMRLQGAVTFKDEPLQGIPASLRFYAGGDNSIRGYAYQEVGPRDAVGALVGGEHLAVGSVELERAIGVNWGVAVFYDAGSAFNRAATIKWFQGAGLGLRRYTRAGPIKIDLARQVGVRDPEIRFHIGVGIGW